MEEKNMNLTERQKEILRFIDDYTAEHGYCPTVYEIKEAMEKKPA